MPRGRKPKPQALAKLEGNTRRQKAAPVPAAPRAADGELDAYTPPPEPPAGLAGDALAHWRELAEPMARAGLLEALDADGLASYCRLWAAARACWTHEQAEAPIVISDGKPIANPWQKEARAYEAAAAKLRAELGLTQVSRGRLAQERKPSSPATNVQVNGPASFGFSGGRFT